MSSKELSLAIFKLYLIREQLYEAGYSVASATVNLVMRSLADKLPD